MESDKQKEIIDQIINLYQCSKDAFDFVDYDAFSTKVCEEFNIKKEDFDKFMEDHNIRYAVIEGRQITKLQEMD